MKKHTTLKFNKIMFSLLTMAVLIQTAMSLQAKPPSEEEAQKACRSDVLAHCKTEAIFGPKKKVQNCLRENKNKISPECKNVLNRGNAFKREMKTNCDPIHSELCGEFEGDQSAMRECIKRNFSKFSPGCREFLKMNR